MNWRKTDTVIMYGAAFLILLLSFVWDILIETKTVLPLVYVREDYIPSLFSGILTFSTLSLTVLSIIISVMDARNYGLKLRDIVFLQASPINFISYILFTMVLTILSVAALAFNLCTFISALTIVSILYTYRTSITVFKIVADSETCKNIVFKEIKDNNRRILNKHLANWINEYKNAITRNDIPEMAMYAEVLKMCTTYVDEAKFDDYLEDLFETSCKNHSGADAINLSFQVLGLSSRICPICKKRAQAIKYYDAYDIHKLDLPAFVESIVASAHTFATYHADILYFYFTAVLYGRMSPAEKTEVLKEMINKITSITEDERGKLKSDLIYRIIINDIICGDSGLNEDLYRYLITLLYCNNLGVRNPIFVKVTARILRSMYFYSELSGQLFDEAKRTSIRQMVQQSIKLDEMIYISVGTWVTLFREAFLDFYVQDLFEDDEILVMNDADNNIDAIEWSKHLVLWNSQNKQRFALWYYFAVCFQFDVVLLEKSISKNGKDNYRKQSAKWIEEFEDDGNALSKHSISQIKKLCTYIGKSEPHYLSGQQIQRAYHVIKKFAEGTEDERA